MRRGVLRKTDKMMIGTVSMGMKGVWLVNPIQLIPINRSHVDWTVR